MPTTAAVPPRRQSSAIEALRETLAEVMPPHKPEYITDATWNLLLKWRLGPVKMIPEKDLDISVQ